MQANPSLSWDDIGRLREWTSLPILLKGILDPDDAREARERGVDGVVVSNHGGRQVDGAIASLDALPAVVDAVGGELAVLLDSGIRCGADVFKALALGAEAVLLGRPYIWGLALGGHEGVETVLKMLLAELDLTLALSGYTSPAELDRSALTRLADIRLLSRPHQQMPRSNQRSKSLALRSGDARFRKMIRASIYSASVRRSG